MIGNPLKSIFKRTKPPIDAIREEFLETRPDVEERLKKPYALYIGNLMTNTTL